MVQWLALHLPPCRGCRFDPWLGSKNPTCLVAKKTHTHTHMGFPCGSTDKESACNAGDLGSTPGLGRSPGEGKGYPLQYSGLENAMGCMGSQRFRYNWATHTHSVLTTSISTSWELVRYAEFWIPALLFGLPRWFSGESIHLQCRRYSRHGFNLWVGKIPWRRAPVFLLEESLEQRSLAGFSRGAAESRTQPSE